ncbi:hypothetical protein ACIRU3_38670 [Streptomyces sp. NPDC101151]|uniref:hypothetical protein n=1 Tax=Streptomyces sp. NPDC101151 TaxID=3366115 RepID=UPI0037F9A3C4
MKTQSPSLADGDWIPVEYAADGGRSPAPPEHDAAPPESGELPPESGVVPVGVVPAGCGGPGAGNAWPGRAAGPAAARERRPPEAVLMSRLQRE